MAFHKKNQIQRGVVKNCQNLEIKKNAINPGNLRLFTVSRTDFLLPRVKHFVEHSGNCNQRTM